MDDTFDRDNKTNVFRYHELASAYHLNTYYQSDCGNCGIYKCGLEKKFEHFIHDDILLFEGIRDMTMVSKYWIKESIQLRIGSENFNIDEDPHTVIKGEMSMC